MRIAMIISGVCLVTACSGGGDNSGNQAATTTTSPGPSTSTVSRPSDLGKFAEEWKPRFTSLTNSGSGNTCGINASTQACANDLTKYVVLAGELEESIKARPDKARYENTLTEIEKVTSAGEQYGDQKCRLQPVRDSAGGNLCESYVIKIVTGVVLVQTKLQADDLTP